MKQYLLIVLSTCTGCAIVNLTLLKIKRVLATVIFYSEEIFYSNFLHWNLWELPILWKMFLYKCYFYQGRNFEIWKKSQNMPKFNKVAVASGNSICKNKGWKKHKSSSKTYCKWFIIHPCLFLHEINTPSASITLLCAYFFFQ